MPILLPTALTHYCTDNTQGLAETCSFLRIVLGQSNSYFFSSCWHTTPGAVLSLSLSQESAVYHNVKLSCVGSLAVV